MYAPLMCYKHLLSSCTQVGMNQMVAYTALKTKAKDTAQAVFTHYQCFPWKKNISSGGRSHFKLQGHSYQLRDMTAANRVVALTPGHSSRKEDNLTAPGDTIYKQLQKQELHAGERGCDVAGSGLSNLPGGLLPAERRRRGRS